MTLDAAFIIIMILAVFKGYSKGFIVGIFSLIAFIIGLVAALKLSVVVAHYLETSTGAAHKVLPFFSFALVFLIVVLLVNIGARIIKKAVSMVMLGWVDKLGGIVLYIIIYTIIFSVVLFFVEKTQMIKPDTISESSVYHYVSPIGPSVINHIGKIVPIFKDLFSQLETFFQNMGHTITT